MKFTSNNMAALNIFKKKAKKDATKEKKTKESKEKTITSKKEGYSGNAYRILRFPHITEKATLLSEGNQYVFKVYPDVNKIEVRKAIENLYGVKVISVKIINVPRRRRRLGRAMGWKGGYKKAVVGVEKGKKIEIMPR